MPIPGTETAPLFDGDNVRDFLQLLIELGASAGIANHNELVPYILRYSVDEVKRVIRYLPEFDRDVPNKEWSKATEMLISIYGSADEPEIPTEEDLKEYCRANHAKPAFADKRAVNEYHRGFLCIAAPLVKYGLLTTKQQDYYFVTGIPASIRASFLQQVPKAKQKRSNPPSIPESVSYLYQRFDKDSLYFDPWSREEDQQSNRIQFNQEETILDNTPALSPPQIEALAQVTLEKVNELLRARATASATPRDHQHIHIRDHTTSFHRCFVCGKSGEELKHLLHPSRCPETLALLAEGLIVFDHSTARYRLPNGEDLPIVRGFHGGIAAYLRSIERAKYNHVLAEQTHFTGLAFEDRRAQRASVTTKNSVLHSNHQTEPLQQPPPRDQLHQLPFIDLEDSPTEPSSLSPQQEEEEIETSTDSLTFDESHLPLNKTHHNSTEVPVIASQIIDSNMSPPESIGVAESEVKLEVSPSKHLFQPLSHSSSPNTQRWHSDSAVNRERDEVKLLFNEFLESFSYPLDVHLSKSFSINVYQPPPPPFSQTPQPHDLILSPQVRSEHSRSPNQAFESVKRVFPWVFQSKGRDKDLRGAWIDEVDDEGPPEAFG